MLPLTQVYKMVILSLIKKNVNATIRNAIDILYRNLAFLNY